MSPSERLPIAISVGDPAGVGPQATLDALAPRGAGAPHGDERFVVFGDAAQLAAIAGDRSIPELEIVDVPAFGDDVGPREPSERGGRAQIAALEAAADHVIAGRARALVTGPTSKEAVTRAGIGFRGQTEHLAQRAGLGGLDVTMLFLGERLHVGLVTTHHAVRAVPDLITSEGVARAAIHLAEAMVALGHHRPLVDVASLNPHAGEGRLFGDEEEDVIAPGIALASRREPFVSGAAELAGERPTGAETAFRVAVFDRSRPRGVVAMMHDQATIAAKLVDWGASVNVTWGLPFVRTSVDHGVAYDAAKSGDVDASGMVHAIRMAQRLTAQRRVEVGDA